MPEIEATADPDVYRVGSDSGTGTYIVDLKDCHCMCTAWATGRNKAVAPLEARGKDRSQIRFICKHIAAVIQRNDLKNSPVLLGDFAKVRGATAVIPKQAKKVNDTKKLEAARKRANAIVARFTDTPDLHNGGLEALREAAKKKP